MRAAVNGFATELDRNQRTSLSRRPALEGIAAVSIGRLEIVSAVCPVDVTHVNDPVTQNFVGWL